MNAQTLTYSSNPGHREGTTVLHLVGPLTLTSMFAFQTDFRAMKPPVLILDLSESPYMDSAGLGLIMNFYVSAENDKRGFLIASVNERIQALLQLTRVHDILRIFPTVADAEASL